MNYSKGVVLILCAGMCWSFVPVGIRGFNEAGVWQILFFRSIGVLPLVFWLIQRQTGGNALPAIRQVGVSGLVGAIGLVAAYAGAIAAVRMTSIANAAFLFATAPFLAAIMASILLGESLRRFTVVALILAMVGIFVMVFDSISMGHWLGNLLALLSATGFAVFATTLRAQSLESSRRKTSQTNKTHSPGGLPVVFVGSCLAILLALVMSVLVDGSLLIPTREILLALAIGTLLLANGMILCTLGSSVVPAAELALLCMTEIIFAPVWAWLFLAELPTPSVLAGGAVVIFAIIVNAVTGMRHKRVVVTQ